MVPKMLTDEDLYSDLPDHNVGNSLAQLETETERLKIEVRVLKEKLSNANAVHRQNEILRRQNKILKLHVSSLLKTARLELQRKEEQYRQRLEDSERRIRPNEYVRNYRDRQNHDRIGHHDIDRYRLENRSSVEHRHHRKYRSSIERVHNSDRFRHDCSRDSEHKSKNENRSHSIDKERVHQRHRSSVEQVHDNDRSRHDRFRDEEYKSRNEERVPQKVQSSIERIHDRDRPKYLEHKFKDEDRSQSKVEERVHRRHLPSREQVHDSDRLRNKGFSDLERKSKDKDRIQSNSEEKVPNMADEQPESIRERFSIMKSQSQSSDDVIKPKVTNGLIANNNRICLKMAEQSYKTPLKDYREILNKFKSKTPITPLRVTPHHIKEKLDECSSVKVSPVPLFNEYRVLDEEGQEIQVKQCRIEIDEKKNEDLEKFPLAETKIVVSSNAEKQQGNFSRKRKKIRLL